MNEGLEANLRPVFGTRKSAVERRPWTETCTTVLLADYQTNTPVLQIAEKLGRTKGSVYGKARRLGLKRPPRHKPAEATVPAIVQPRFATAEQVCGLLTSKDNPIVVNGPIVVAPEEPILPATAEQADPQPIEEPQPAYVRTPINGRQSVWFPKLTERMMRLWFAAVDVVTIAEVLGPQITDKAVYRKAHRASLPPRHGLTLIRDIEVAREIDRKAEPLPKEIRRGRKVLKLRFCSKSQTPFYAENASLFSDQAKETKWYARRGEDEYALAAMI